jgi:hypothetical protein
VTRKKGVTTSIVHIAIKGYRGDQITSYSAVTVVQSARAKLLTLLPQRA